MQYVDGRCYSGNWVSDVASGHGKMVFPNTTVEESVPLSPSTTLRSELRRLPRSVVSYEGGWENGKRHGAGVITYSDGSVLRGVWEAGSLSKSEPATLTDGISGAVVTEGEYKGDVLLRGRETASSEDSAVGSETFLGSFNAAGQRHGKGSCTYSDGSLYEGEWRSGRRNGKGIYRDAVTKDVYDGKWVADKRCGRGLCTYPAGHRYEGQWADDLRHGEGSFFKSNGETYSGAWAAGERHGHGVHTDSRGRVKSGSWRFGKLLDSDEAKVEDDSASLDGPSITDGASMDWNADSAV